MGEFAGWIALVIVVLVIVALVLSARAGQQPRPYTAAMGRVPQTHRVILDGVTARILSFKENGRRITLTGWTMRHKEWNNGDFLLLREGKLETRYVVERMVRPNNPIDMYFADCVFAPRGA